VPGCFAEILKGQSRDSHHIDPDPKLLMGEFRYLRLSTLEKDLEQRNSAAIFSNI
jgi:hypothetical protein